MRARHVAAVLLVAAVDSAAVEQQRSGAFLQPAPVPRLPVFPRLVALPWNASAAETPPASLDSSLLRSSPPPPTIIGTWTTSNPSPPVDSDSARGPVGSSSPSTTVVAFTPPSGTIGNLTTAASASWEPTSVEASTTSSASCIPQEANVETVISIVYTATTTFYGDPARYTAPHPELTTPNLCPLPTDQEGPGDHDNPGGSDNLVPEMPCQENNCQGLTAESPQSTTSIPRPKEVFITFVTTDKNPSVVYSPMSTPSFGKETGNGADHFPNHTAEPPRRPQTRLSLPQAGASREPTPAQTFTVTAAPTKVIINSKTVTMKPAETTRVTVDGEVFTIDPIRVVGGGGTIKRPGHGQGHDAADTPLTTVVGTVPVVVAPSGQRSVALIDGTAVTAGASGTTVVVGGHHVIVLPGAVVFPSLITIHLPSERPVLTEIFVEGGRMITAIGPTVAVIDGTTVIYGQGIPATETTINGEAVTIGPSGVVVGSKTIGGPGAAQQDVEIKIVGGATLTQIGESILVIDDTTFTVGPGGDGPLTTDVGGEEITIGPEGVFFSTISLPYPFGPTVVTAIVATPSATASDLPAETDGAAADGDRSGRVRADKDENGARALEVSLSLMLFCIAVGVWEWDQTI